MKSRRSSKIRGDVSQALSEPENDSVRDEFLGYPPVSEALARFAVDDLPGKQLAELNSSTQVRYAYSLLVEVVLFIGERERDKLAKIVSTRSKHLGDVIQNCYGVDAQVRMLLHGDSDATPNFPTNSRRRMRSTWEHLALPVSGNSLRRSDLVGLPNPLMRFASVVFRDYCIARAFRFFDDSNSWTCSRTWTGPNSSLLRCWRVSIRRSRQ